MAIEKKRSRSGRRAGRMSAIKADRQAEAGITPSVFYSGAPIFYLRSYSRSKTPSAESPISILSLKELASTTKR